MSPLLLLPQLESALGTGIANGEENPWGGRQVRHWAGWVLCVSKRELRAGGSLPWKGSRAQRLPGPWELIAVWGESE